MLDDRVAVEKRSAGGDRYCGDACSWIQRDGHIWLCTVDGLGHGRGAQVAAEAAVEFVQDHVEKDLIDLFRQCDQAIRHTRGAVMGIAMIEEESNTLSFAGVGNTRCLLLGRTSTRMISYPGIVGAGFRTLRVETASIEPGSHVVMYTDGLPEAIDLLGYPAEHGSDLTGMARAIMNDWYRGNDDGAVMVFRYEGTSS